MRTARWAVGLWVALASVTPALAQAPRTDAIWARSTAGAAITMDGQLNEPAWAAAETWKVRYRYDNGIPGSGWKDEAGFIPNGSTSDSTNATLKFLVVSDTLYLCVIVPDKSIGGSGQFNRFDGLLMALKDRGNANFPKPPVEYLYSWWYPAQSGDVNPCKNDSAKGNPPIFKGQWAPNPVCDALGNVNTRTAEQMAAWNARTVVNGITNSDTTLDVGYTVEMRFDLGVMGYDVTRPQGDIVEWNLSIYDCDQFWKSSITAEFSDNRAWWQCPWGNVAEQDEVRIYARPDVTINSGPAPVIGPELRIPNNGTVALPTIDGQLTDGIWSQTPHFDIRWGDDPLRATYPGVGPWRSGQFQPNVQGGQAFVADGGDATVKYFYSGDWLYMGFDARDKYVQSYPVEDRWDGFTVSITNRTEVDPQDHNLQGKALSFIVS